MTVLDMLRAVREHIALVLVAMLACGLLAGAYAFIALPDQFAASVSLYVQNGGDSAKRGSKTAAEAALADFESAGMLTKDIAQLAETPGVWQETADAMGLPSLDGYGVSADGVKDTRIVNIKVTGPAADQVSVVANTLATTVGTKATSTMGVNNVSVLTAAQVPYAPSGPDRWKYILVGLLVGLLAALVFVLVGETGNSVIRSKKDVEELLQMPVICKLPSIG